MTYETKYAIGDRVTIIELEHKAHVISISISRGGIQYEVAYFHAGERKTAYCFEEELKPCANGATKPSSE